MTDLAEQIPNEEEKSPVDAEVEARRVRARATSQASEGKKPSIQNYEEAADTIEERDNRARQIESLREELDDVIGPFDGVVKKVSSEYANARTAILDLMQNASDNRAEVKIKQLELFLERKFADDVRAICEDPNNGATENLRKAMVLRTPEDSGHKLDFLIKVAAEDFLRPDSDTNQGNEEVRGLFINDHRELTDHRRQNQTDEEREMEAQRARISSSPGQFGG